MVTLLRLSLVAETGDYSVAVHSFSLQWLLLLGSTGSGAWAQWLWPTTGLVVPHHVEFSQIRNQTRVPFISRQTQPLGHQGSSPVANLHRSWGGRKGGPRYSLNDTEFPLPDKHFRGDVTSEEPRDEWSRTVALPKQPLPALELSINYFIKDVTHTYGK